VTHEEAQELLGVYALDAVDGPELEALERHLAECPRCRAEVAEHREVAVLLAHGGADAPEGLWDRIAGALDTAPPPMEITSLVARRRRRSIPWPAAVSLLAAAVLAVVFLGVQVNDQANRIDQLQSAMGDPLDQAVNQAIDAPGSTLVDLRSTDGQIVVRGAITKSGLGYLRTSGLPALPAGHTYQLWGATGDGMVSLGVLGGDPTVVTFHDADYNLFAITAEDSPTGVVTSHKAAVVTGERTA
jgi:hypothetical protein